MEIPIIVLAAGESSRLGRPKQLLPWKGSTLLSRTVQTAIESGIGEVYVVIGASARLIKPELENYPVQIIINRQYMNGLSTSLKTGLEHATKDNPQSEAVIFCLADQPYLDSLVLRQLAISFYTSKQPLIHCQYKRALTGPPSLIGKKYFPFIKKLTGDAGAKKVFSQFPDDVGIVDFPNGEIDIDTWADYTQLEP